MEDVFIGIMFFSIIMCIVSVGALMVWSGYQYPRDYNYALTLADDSSLPLDKANYLKEYYSKVDTIKGKPRYIFMTPDLELSKQKEILKSLIQRFEDIAKLDPSNMAYQQGMYQLTGQEMEHQMKRISDIFKSAKLRESLFRYLFFWSWIFWVIVGFVSFMGVIS